MVSEGPTHRYAALGNVLITLYWGTPQVAALRERKPWVEKTLGRYEGMGLLVVIDSAVDGKLPGADFRRESKAQAAAYGDRVRVSASAIEGDTLKFSLIRTFMRGLAIVVKPAFPVKFFSNVTDASVFAAHCVQIDRGPSAAALADAVKTIRPNLAPT